MGAGVIGALYGIYLAVLGEAALGGVLIVMGIVLFLASATRFMDRLRAGSIGEKIFGTKAVFVVGDNGVDSTIAGKAYIAWSSYNISESDRLIVLRRGIGCRWCGCPSERCARASIAARSITRATATDMRDQRSPGGLCLSTPRVPGCAGNGR